MSRDAEKIVGLYDRHADAWDKDRSRRLMEKAWLDRFRALLPAGGTILDIGCGGAEPIARYLIEAGHALTGIDSSPRMIAICTHRFPQQSWRVADMRELSLVRRFDGLIAWDSFFHLTPQHQREMFARFGAHAAPGTALLFTSGPRHGEAIGTYQGEPLYHGSLDAAEYQKLLASNGFEVVSHVAEDPACGGHTVWLARLA
jgi:trans-aconitate methyltransferase